MKKYLSIALVLAVVGSFVVRAPARQQPGVGGSAFHKNDTTYSTEVVTPHVAWATKL